MSSNNGNGDSGPSIDGSNTDGVVDAGTETDGSSLDSSQQDQTKPLDEGCDLPRPDAQSDLPTDLPVAQPDLPVSDLPVVTPDLPAPDLPTPDLAPDLPTPDLAPDLPTPDLSPDGSGGCVHPVVTKSCTNGWCTIPAGCFWMGSPATELCRSANEDHHPVTLTHAFVMAETETTQTQFKAVMGYDAPYFNVCGNCPAEAVTRDEAMAYCNKLSSDEGRPQCYSCIGSGQTIKCNPSAGDYYACKGYRLPTEAEFEYAQRAGTTTATYNGDLTKCANKADPIVDAIAWYQKSAQTTQPVAGLQFNGWGLYDMAGNVNEWMYDRYTYNLGTAPQVDPLNVSGTFPVVRGGSFFSDASWMRSAARGYIDISGAGTTGFRCVRSL
jgi:formylglycine-generating enzyme required for sulfatase activity